MLSQIDRIYGWEATPDNAFRDSLAKQKASVVREFEHRVEQTKVAFAEQCRTLLREQEFCTQRIIGTNLSHHGRGSTRYDHAFSQPYTTAYE